jgi:hypothetical protein
MIDHLPIIPELENVVPFYLQNIIDWPFSDDKEWPSVVVAPHERSREIRGIEMILLKIVVPLPVPLYAHVVEWLAIIMTELSTTELDPFACAGRTWHIGDGDDTQSSWIDGDKLNVWLRSWPEEQAIMIDPLSRPILIHCCKDKTLSYRTKGRIFNGVALPVFSVDSVDEAEALLTLVGRTQYGEHPHIPGQLWRKITLDGSLDFKRHLDVEDLNAVTAKLSKAYAILKGATE